MSMRILTLSALLLLAFGCTDSPTDNNDTTDQTPPDVPHGMSVATFAGGCFWCMEPPFEALDGVESVVSGYTGGEETYPTYEEVSSGATGHVEAVQVTFDTAVATYQDLLDAYWRSFDPTDTLGQFADRGPQYKPLVFYHNDKQRQLAEASKAALDQSGVFDRPIIVPIREAAPFYPAEDYHQNYWLVNPKRYYSYAAGSGRKGFITDAWGVDSTPYHTYTVPSDSVLMATLTQLQYDVTQNDATEPSFNNEYWDNHDEGIYVDIVSGEPLFASTHKYESGTGWPSFTQPVQPQNIVELPDSSYGMVRVEVRSYHGDSHLGHVFTDGPPPYYLRYCMNSASLRFIAAADLEAEGYRMFRVLFE